MSPKPLALKYMNIFYSNADIDALRPILAENLRFEGPFYQFDTAEAYLNSLRDDSRDGLAYQLIKSFSGESSACLIYRFSKPGLSTPMAQLFEVKGDKISRITLIFDTQLFHKV